MKKQAKFTEITWGEDPELSGPRNFFRETLIIQALEKYKQKGLVLDAGCGNGSLSIRLASKGYKIEAVDQAKKSLKYFKDKCVAMNLTKTIHVQYGDITRLKFKKETFDAVVCGEVLEHVENDLAALREFYKVLKKGGFCVITVPANPQLWDITDTISGHKRRYMINQLEKRCKKVNFTLVKSFYFGFPLNYLWHKYVFTPFLSQKIILGKNITKSTSFTSRIIKNNSINMLFSFFFYIDMLFKNKGNCLLLVVQK